VQKARRREEATAGSTPARSEITPFCLLDQDAAGKCGRQLLIQALRIDAGPMLGNAEGGEIREGPRDDEVRLGHWLAGRTKQIERSEAHRPQPKRQS
jgi:hypothetical protein